MRLPAIRTSRHRFAAALALTLGWLPTISTAGNADLVETIPDLVAFWTFGENGGTRRSQFGASDFALTIGGGTVARSVGGPFSGYSANFNGTTDHLRLANADLGDLNIAGSGADVTVVAWIRRDDANTGFIGGIWQENNNDPRRQYGLFVDLPTYGGPGNVAGHVSFSGGASPDLPFSRDYSANQTRVYNGEWTTVAFTYDGAYARSFINAKFEARPTYTEPGPNLGQGLTYAKNPYFFPQGLGDNGGDFTVGAVRLTAGLGNFYRGQIGGLAVYDRALTAPELFVVHAASLDPGAAASRFDFRNDNGGNRSPATVAWSAFGSPSENSSETTSPWLIASENGAGSTTGYLARTGTGQPGIAWTDSVPAIATSLLDRIEFTLNNSSSADALRLVIQLDGDWYATTATFQNADSDGRATNWAAESELMTFAWTNAAASWHNLNFNQLDTLALGTPLAADLPVGTLEAIGFYQTATVGTLRIDNLDLHVNLTAIPEPSSVALLGLAGILTALIATRKRRQT